MRRRALVEVPLAFVLKRLLGTAPPPPASAGQARPARATAPLSAAPRRREPSALVALASLVVGALLLFVFDEWFTRLLGVLGLFAFIVAGVFAIASPPFLEREGEDG